MDIFGRMPGSARARRVFPAPEGPIIIMFNPPVIGNKVVMQNLYDNLSTTCDGYGSRCRIPLKRIVKYQHDHVL
jgi:hypothetical protein